MEQPELLKVYSTTAAEKSPMATECWTACFYVKWLFDGVENLHILVSEHDMVADLRY